MFTAVRSAQSTADQALDAEWQTVSTAWNAWQKDVAQQTREAELDYQQSSQTAQQTRQTQDFTTNTNASTQFQQSRNTFQNESLDR